MRINGLHARGGTRPLALRPMDATGYPQEKALSRFCARARGRDALAHTANARLQDEAPYFSFHVTVTRASSVSVPASMGTESALDPRMAIGRGPP